MMYHTAQCPDPTTFLQYLSGLADSVGGYALLGTFSAAIYDTAWLSMVYKHDMEQPYCVFPQCFDHIVDAQQDDGTWRTYGSPVDGIVNSLAALLSLATNAEKILANRARYDLDRRIQAARHGIERLLQSWNVSATPHVGFEVIITSLLRQLDKLGICFTFNGYDELNELGMRKMKKFSPELIYSDRQTSILHSAEALTGIIDFNKISHHCSATHGILGSPAATAAYLSHATSWDYRAEAYLRKVLECHGNGGQVPSAYPTSIFEISWAISTLLSVNPVVDGQDDQILSAIKDFLGAASCGEDGVAGFAPGVLADADDTARVLITLKRLGQDIDPTPMIKLFETADNFKTYDLERNPSFTANCNVLLALLEAKSIEDFSPQIFKILDFLLRSWNSSQVSDKWNSSSAYALMLLTEALCLLLKRYHEGHVTLLLQLPDIGKILLVLCEILQHVFKEQIIDGSWERSIEVTSYNALTLIQLLSLPWIESLKKRMRAALAKAQRYITVNFAVADNDRYLWIEKTTFRIESLNRAYCAAAVAAKEASPVWGPDIHAMFALPPSAVAKTEALLSFMPLFRETPIKDVELVLFQAQCYSTFLQKHRHDIYARDDLPMTRDKYLKYIPLIWLSCNSISEDSLSPCVIYDMLKLSLYVYQIDEFMESIAVKLSVERCQSILRSLRLHCNLEDNSLYTFEKTTKSVQNSMRGLPGAENLNVRADESRSSWNSTSEASLGKDVLDILQKFLDYILQHPAVQESPPSVQRLVAIDVYDFVKAHVEHNSDSAAWIRSKPTGRGFYLGDISRGGDFYGWLNSTAATDTSCPFAFRFFSCLISQGNQPCFRGAEAEFYSQSVANHLSVMCRLYNDWGSAQRDSAEGNLNCLNFAEFDDPGHIHRGSAHHGQGTEDPSNGGPSQPESEILLKGKKDSLMALASFERALMGLAFERLSLVVPPAALGALKIFVNVTDLFGQIYVQKDLSSRKQERTE